MEQILTMANLKLKPSLCTPRLTADDNFKRFFCGVILLEHYMLLINHWKFYAEVLSFIIGKFYSFQTPNYIFCKVLNVCVCVCVCVGGGG